MPHWLIKSAIHRVIAVLPGSQKWNEWFQVRVTKSLELGAEAFAAKLEATRQYLADFLELRPECADGFSALELGTGWYPIVPISLYLCGAREIWSFDIDPLLRRDRLKQVLKYFCEFDERGKLRELLPALRTERMDNLRAVLKDDELQKPESMLAKLNIHALVRDAQNTGLKEKTIDLFFSYSVLEYIPAAVQSGLYAEFGRLATPNAVLIQYVSMKDQFCHFDKTITTFNNLRYSARLWRWLDSPLIPQTRLRITDYRRLMEAAGFKIKKEINTTGPIVDLEKIRLAPEFKKYAKEDLLVITSWQVAQKQ